MENNIQFSFFYIYVKYHHLYSYKNINYAKNIFLPKEKVPVFTYKNVLA